MNITKSPPIIKGKFTDREKDILRQALHVLDQACGREYDPKTPINEFGSAKMANDAEPLSLLLTELMKRY